MMNSKAIRPNVAPKDGNMRFDMAECEAMLPAGIVDKNVERVYKEVQGNSTSLCINATILLLPHFILFFSAFVNFSFPTGENQICKQGKDTSI